MSLIHDVILAAVIISPTGLVLFTACSDKSCRDPGDMFVCWIMLNAIVVAPFGLGYAFGGLPLGLLVLAATLYGYYKHVMKRGPRY